MYAHLLYHQLLPWRIRAYNVRLGLCLVGLFRVLVGRAEDGGEEEERRKMDWVREMEK